MRQLLQVRLPEELLQEVEEFRKSHSEEIGFQLNKTDTISVLLNDALKNKRKNQVSV